MKIKLTKISECNNPVVKASSKKSFKPGEDNGDVSLPVDYNLTGWTMRPIIIGKTMAVLRDTRNGVECEGIFTSSIVKEIKDNLITTQNSIYKIEYIKPKNVQNTEESNKGK